MPPHHGPLGARSEKPKDMKKTMRRVVGLVRPFAVSFIVVLLFAIGSTVFSVLSPSVLAQATTAIFSGLVEKVAGTGGIDFELIGRVLLTVLALYVASVACSFVQSWIMAGITQKIGYRLRRQILAKIDRMPFGFFERSAVGDTLSRITNDVDTLAMNLSQGVSQVITTFVTIVGVLAIMISLNGIMTIIVVICAPVSALLMMVVIKKSQKYYEIQQGHLGVINSFVEETFSGHDVVRAYNREEDTIERFNRENDVLYEAGWKSQFISSFIKPAMDIVTNAGYVLVAVVGSVFAAQGVITVGTVQAFIQYEKNFMQPIQQLSQVASMLQQMAAAAERIFDFLDEPEELAESSEEKIEGGCQAIDFDHIQFGYDPGKPVIRDFTCHVEPGQMVALVGPTGAGKTTIVKLLMRFYEVQSGAIRIAGKDIREYTRTEIRDNFGMVLQDAWLFHGSIRENLRYGKLDATDEEIKDAAIAASAHHFITTLPGGYDFEINEDASNISQGERQLLTIARAILANRSMLLLDEATSSVDTRTEKKIQDAMDRLMEGRTSFVIAHRLSTIKNANLILVIRDGDIVEQGTHESLLLQDGFYAELYNSQFNDCE